MSVTCLKEKKKRHLESNELQTIKKKKQNYKNHISTYIWKFAFKVKSFQIILT